MTYKGILKLVFVILMASMVLLACERDVAIPKEATPFEVKLIIPSNFPQPVYNFEDNPLTKAGFILGRKLFYDPKLSRDNSISCGSCHQSFAGFAHSEHRLSHGINGQFGTRNSPGLSNLIWQKTFMWDGGVNHIELQPLAPIANPVEMDEKMDNIITKLTASEEYRNAFKTVFGDEKIDTKRIMLALTQFMGMLNSYNSRYDKYVRGESDGSFSKEELNGLNLFRSKCASCHTEPLFTDNSFHNNGLPIDPVLNDIGRMKITQNVADSMVFKTPSLRNVDVTAPYMHDGRFKTLKLVLAHYTNGIHTSSTLDPKLLNGIALTPQEQNDIIRFLQTLTDYSFITDERFAEPIN